MIPSHISQKGTTPGGSVAHNMKAMTVSSVSQHKTALTCGPLKGLSGGEEAGAPSGSGGSTRTEAAGRAAGTRSARGPADASAGIAGGAVSLREAMSRDHACM